MGVSLNRSAKMTAEQRTNEAQSHSAAGRYSEALAAYRQAIRLDPNQFVYYNGKGSALRSLKRYSEALVAFEQSIRLSPDQEGRMSCHHCM